MTKFCLPILIFFKAIQCPALPTLSSRSGIELDHDDDAGANANRCLFKNEGGQKRFLEDCNTFDRYGASPPPYHDITYHGTSLVVSATIQMSLLVLTQNLRIKCSTLRFVAHLIQ